MNGIRMFLLLLFVSVSNQMLFSQETVKIHKLVICEDDKSEVSFLLSDSPVISFRPYNKNSESYRKMIVTTKKRNILFDTRYLDKMYVVSFDEVTGIADIAEECEFIFKDNAVLVDVKSGMATVGLYTPDGKEVLNKRVAVGRHAMQLTGLAKGYYIVEVNDETFKISIR